MKPKHLFSVVSQCIRVMKEREREREREKERWVKEGFGNIPQEAYTNLVNGSYQIKLYKF